jgi:hypothetical protein
MFKTNLPQQAGGRRSAAVGATALHPSGLSTRNGQDSAHETVCPDPPHGRCNCACGEWDGPIRPGHPQGPRGGRHGQPGVLRRRRSLREKNCPRPRFPPHWQRLGGEMAEWFKAHAWKACVAKHYRGFESLSLRHFSFYPCKHWPFSTFSNPDQNPSRSQRQH